MSVWSATGSSRPLQQSLRRLQSRIGLAVFWIRPIAVAVSVGLSRLNLRCICGSFGFLCGKLLFRFSFRHHRDFDAIPQCPLIDIRLEFWPGDSVGYKGVGNLLQELLLRVGERRLLDATSPNASGPKLVTAQRSIT